MGWELICGYTSESHNKAERDVLKKGIHPEWSDYLKWNPIKISNVLWSTWVSSINSGQIMLHQTWNITPWRTKIAPKNPWLEDELPFGMVPFQGTLEFPNTQYLLKVCSWTLNTRKTRRPKKECPNRAPLYLLGNIRNRSGQTNLKNIWSFC